MVCSSTVICHWPSMFDLLGWTRPRANTYTPLEWTSGSNRVASELKNVAVMVSPTPSTSSALNSCPWARVGYNAEAHRGPIPHKVVI